MDQIERFRLQDERELIGGLPISPGGKALFSWVEKEVQKEREWIEENPTHEEVHVRIGIIKGLKRVLDKPRKCQENIR